MQLFEVAGLQPRVDASLQNGPLIRELLRTETTQANDRLDRRQESVGDVRHGVRVGVDDYKGAHDRRNASLSITAPVEGADALDGSSSTAVPASRAVTWVARASAFLTHSRSS